MANPLDSNTKVTFTDMSHIMGEMSKQTVTITEGTRSYEEASKIYVKLGETGHLVTVQGPQAKREKGISAEKLADTVENVIIAAANSGQFKKADISELEQMLKGMETLRDRMTVSQGSMSPVKRFIFAAFGYTDKFDAALVKINNAINIAKQQTIVIQIENLIHKSDANRLKLQEIKTELEELYKYKTNNNDEKKQTEYEKEIEKLTTANKELELQKQQLSDKKALLFEITQPVREAEETVTVAKEKFELAKKVKGVTRIPPGIWTGKNSDGVRQGKAAEKALQKAEKKLEAQKKLFEKPLKELNELEKTLKKIGKEKQENDEILKKTIALLKPILKRQEDIQAREKTL